MDRAALVAGLILLAVACARSQKGPDRADRAATGAPPGAVAARTGGVAGSSGGARGVAALAARVYVCPGGSTVELRPTRGSTAVDATIDGKSARLPRAVAASGDLYSDGTVGVWAKGNEVLVERGGTRQTCAENRTLSIDADARLRGVDFRGVGNEPAWVLELHPDRIEFTYDYARGKVVLPRPAPESTGGATEYHRVSETNDLRVRVVQRECTDAMSGERFPASVEVVLNSKRYTGCGRRLR